MYRAAQLASTFNTANKRLNYNNALQPVIRENQICLRVDAETLKRERPEVYKQVMAITRFLDSKLLELEV